MLFAQKHESMSMAEGSRGSCASVIVADPRGVCHLSPFHQEDPHDAILIAHPSGSLYDAVSAFDLMEQDLARSLQESCLPQSEEEDLPRDEKQRARATYPADALHFPPASSCPKQLASPKSVFQPLDDAEAPPGLKLGDAAVGGTRRKAPTATRLRGRSVEDLITELTRGSSADGIDLST